MSPEYENHGASSPAPWASVSSSTRAESGHQQGDEGQPAPGRPDSRWHACRELVCNGDSSHRAHLPCLGTSTPGGCDWHLRGPPRPRERKAGVLVSDPGVREEALS